MNMHQCVVDQLEQLAAKGPEHIGAVIKLPRPGCIVGVENNGVGASLQLADYDRFSVMLACLEVRDNHLTIAASSQEAFLKRCAAEMTQRLGYLEAPFTLLELNPAEGVAQMRSESPHSDQNLDQAIYWELMLYTGPHPHARLTRHEWTADRADRGALVYPATFATVARLVQDLTDSLNEAAEGMDA